MKPDKTGFPQELEVKYFIVDDNPGQIAEQISGLDHINQYELANPQSIEIHDIYLDTADEIFRQNRLALRLRKENGQYFITVKGKTKVREWGGIERLEMENSWSAEAFQKMLSDLKAYGVHLQVNPEWLKDDNPLESLQNWGLQIIQDRHTVRLTHQVKFQNENIAELAIDKVTYGENNRNLVHHEIEIEAKNPQEVSAIHEIQRELQSRFGDSLKLAVFSKLMLGMVLLDLPENPQFFDLQKPVTHLLPAAYEWIEQRLKGMHE